MANNGMTAAERIALAKRLGAEAIAETDPERVTGGEAVAEFLLRAAKSRNHALGLERLSAAEGAQRETERLALINAALAACKG